MDQQDTIAGISTAVSEAGIGIIRISGNEAIAIVDRLFHSPGDKVRLTEALSHTINYGYIQDPVSGEVLDEVLVSVMRAPRTFTAEDTAEINCHGSVYGLKKVLNAVFRCGARPAEPGEFTKRAFLNGRIDLSQAEAVMDLISAQSDYALKSAVSQLKGNIKEKIISLRRDILYDTAKIESALDDPEHYSLEGFSTLLLNHVRKEKEEIHQLIISSDEGRLIREGIKTVILGKPNAGKSSLLNRLLGEERAIVTQIPGTTRDTISETINIGEISLLLVDTAGVRNTDDPVESIGVKKAMEQAMDADLILYVCDRTMPLDGEDDRIFSLIKDKKIVILLNKTDLSTVIDEEQVKEHVRSSGMKKELPILSVSMTEGTGLEALEKAIKDMFYQGDISFNDQIVITNVRHRHLLEQAAISLDRVEESIEELLPEDFYTIDMMDAYNALGEIIGETAGEDLIDEIFSRFCMGK